MREILVKLGERSYDIIITPYGLKLLGSLIKDKNLGEQAAVISDETVANLYSQPALESLQEAGIESTLYVVPDGEDSKSLEQTEKLYTRLIESNLKRDGLVIALGGGVVGDLAGFVAATYLRGVSLVQVPTTLLAQVDSSVGGKVGINHPLGKNLIGSFYQPRLVLIDPNVLSTLEKRELWAGMAEVVKYGLIWDKSFFSFVESHFNDFTQLEDKERISDMVAFCCRAKADVVERDEKEGGLRRILNFGHTLGHALEAVTDFHYYRHGEAVVHGMNWSSWVSWVKGYLSESEFKRIETLLKQFPIPHLPKGIDTQTLNAKTLVDKKQSGKGLHLVLLERIGRTKIEKCFDLSDLIQGWLQYVQK